MPSRRQLLAGFGSTAAVGLSGCLGRMDLSTETEMDFSPGTDADDDWPMPRHDPSNTAYNADAKAPRDGVAERWTYERGAATGPPAIVDGTVFLSTSQGLVALDSASGEEVWQYSPDGGWAAPPVVHDGVVYLTEVGRSGVYAVDADAGEVVWSDPDAGSGPAGVHLLAGEHVSDPVLYLGSRDGEVVRLDAATGEVTWRNDLFGEISAFGYRFGSLYVGTYGGELYAYSDTVDGVEEPGEMWRRKVGSAVETILPDEEGVLVDTFGGPLQCLKDAAHAGTTRWTIDKKWAGSAPVNAGYAFFTAGYEGLSAVREYDKKTEWRLDGRFDSTGPVAAGDTLYVSNGDAIHAFALDGGTGAFGHRFDAKRWSHPTPAGAVEGLAIADGALFAACRGSEEGDVSLYSLESPN
jgi:outer membrane protein assembly factor BamB